MKSVKFGLIADTQYADRPMSIGRYYRNALAKTELCIEALQREDVDFLVHLGDLIDWPNQPDKGCEALDTFLEMLSRFKGPKHYVLGNHDLSSVPYNEIANRMGFNSEKSWYSFGIEDVQFITLDCNFDAQGERYRPDNSQWDQCFIPTEELAWLEEALNNTWSNCVILFVHALLDDFDNPHVIRNAHVVRSILEKSGKQIVVFQGHMHSGHESKTNGICYYTMKSIVDGPTRTCFWTVEVNSSEIHINRYSSTLRGNKPKKEILSRR